MTFEVFVLLKAPIVGCVIMGGAALGAPWLVATSRVARRWC